MQLIQLALPALAASLVLVPQPTGPYGVASIDLELVQRNRTDPYTGNPERKIPISIFTPAGSATECRPVEKKYLPEAVALYWEKAFGQAYNLSLTNTWVQLAISLCEAVPQQESYPLILFEPGEGINRQFYSILASSIAAQGFTIVTIDDPGEDNIIVFANGSIEYAASNFSTIPELTAAVNVRVEDAQFVLTNLSSNGTEPWREYCKIDGSSAAILGHSFGGAVADAAVTVDSRFVGGVNLDGGMEGPGLNQTTTKPFMIFASDMPGMPHDQAHSRGWAAVWRNLRGPKWQLQLLGSAHATFGDWAVFASLFDLYRQPAAAEVVGTIDAQRSLKILVSVLSTFVSYLFGGNTAESVSETAREFAEVVITNATLAGS